MGSIVRAEAQRSLAFGSIGAGYTIIGTVFTHPVNFIRVYNQTDALLQFSYDGSTDHEALPEGGYFVIDVNSNKSNNQNGLYFSAYTGVYVKRIGTPTTGSVYVSAYYER